MEDNVAGLRSYCRIGKSTVRFAGFRIAFRCTWIRLYEPFCDSFIIISIANISNYYSESMTISSRITSDLRVSSSTSSLVIQTFASRAVVLGSYFQNRLFIRVTLFHEWKL
jgi:hypothetical protein